MPNPARRVNKVGVDNTRKVCSNVLFSTCVVMVNQDSTPLGVTIVDGETLNDTIIRLATETNSMRKQIKVLQSEILNLKKKNINNI